jgi:hypothetical protein
VGNKRYGVDIEGGIGRMAVKEANLQQTDE